MGIVVPFQPPQPLRSVATLHNKALLRQELPHLAADELLLTRLADSLSRVQTIIGEAVSEAETAKLTIELACAYFEVQSSADRARKIAHTFRLLKREFPQDDELTLRRHATRMWRDDGVG